MYVPAAYLAVVLVWSTTPLGVQWSSEGISPVMGALSRMFLAALIGWAAARVMKVAIPWHGKAIRLYAISNIGLFVGLMSVYIGATLIPSGMISVIFGEVFNQVEKTVETYLKKHQKTSNQLIKPLTVYLKKLIYHFRIWMAAHRVKNKKMSFWLVNWFDFILTNKCLQLSK